MGHVGSPFRHPGRAPGYQGLLYQASSTSPPARAAPPLGCLVRLPRQGPKQEIQPTSPVLSWCRSTAAWAAIPQRRFHSPALPRSAARESDLTDQGVAQRAVTRPSRLRRPVPQTSRTRRSCPFGRAPNPSSPTEQRQTRAAKEVGALSWGRGPGCLVRQGWR